MMMLKSCEFVTLDILEDFINNGYHHIYPSIESYVQRKTIRMRRVFMYYLTLIFHVIYTLRWAIIMQYPNNNVLNHLGEFHQHKFKIQIQTTSFFYAGLFVTFVIIFINYFDFKHVNYHFDILYHIRARTPGYRLSNKYERKLFISSCVLAKISKVSYRKFLTPTLCMSTSFLAINRYLIEQDDCNIITLMINSLAFLIWIRQLISMVLYGSLLFYIIMTYLKYRFMDMLEVIRSFNLINTNATIFVSYDHLSKLVKSISLTFNTLIGLVYLTSPFVTNTFIDMFIDNDLSIIPRMLAFLAFAITFIANYIIYYTASSISQFNIEISKILYPTCTKRHHIKYCEKKMKIDSFIDRLNNEFIGFNCLFFIKFNRMSFYEYIMTFSSCYFLVYSIANKSFMN